LGHDSIGEFDYCVDVIKFIGYSEAHLAGPVKFHKGSAQGNQNIYEWKWNATTDLADGTKVSVYGISNDESSLELGRDYLFV
jgi:hypothetical protein